MADNNRSELKHCPSYHNLHAYLSGSAAWAIYAHKEPNVSPSLLSSTKFTPAMGIGIS